MNFASTKERIIEFLNYKCINTSAFLEKTGIKRGFLDGDKLKSTVSDIFIAKIIAAFPDINIEWLVTGGGEMIKEENEKEKNRTDIVPLLDRIEKLSAENALLKKENEELKIEHKKRSRNTDVPFPMVAEPEIEYKENIQKP